MKGDEVVEAVKKLGDTLLLLSCWEADKTKEGILGRDLHVVLRALVNQGV